MSKRHKTVKAGWAEAPCTIIRVPGLSMLQAVIKVTRIVRDIDNTTFIGKKAWDSKGEDRLVVPNHEYIGIL